MVEVNLTPDQLSAPACPGCGNKLENWQHTFIPAYDHVKGVPNAWSVPVGYVTMLKCNGHGPMAVAWRENGSVLTVVPFRTGYAGMEARV